MAASSPATPQEYLDALPEDRREALGKVRDVIRANLPDGFEEGMQYGMIGYYVPLNRFPKTYNGQPLDLAGLASQKNYMSLYLNNVYGNRDLEGWFRDRYAESGKKLNMGKSCVRFTKVSDLALDVIGKTIARTPLDAFLEHYETAQGSSRKTRNA